MSAYLLDYKKTYKGSLKTYTVEGIKEYQSGVKIHFSNLFRGRERKLDEWIPNNMILAKSELGIVTKKQIIEDDYPRVQLTELLEQAIGEPGQSLDEIKLKIARKALEGLKI